MVWPPESTKWSTGLGSERVKGPGSEFFFFFGDNNHINLCKDLLNKRHYLYTTNECGDIKVYIQNM